MSVSNGTGGTAVDDGKANVVSMQTARERKTSERRKKAVVLLSGGLDSATVMSIAVEDGYEIYALTFRYGQRHSREVVSASALALHYGAREHKVFDMDLGQIGGSALTDGTMDVPVDRDESEMADIPPTYVPARNTILLSVALGYAEVVGAEAIFTGVNAVDYSGYPDCRPEYISAFQRMADLATKRGVEGEPIMIVAPLQELSKSQIIERGLSLGVPYHLTWSCYTGELRACGRCDSCILRLKGFTGAGAEDPLEYAENE